MDETSTNPALRLADPPVEDVRDDGFSLRVNRDLGIAKLRAVPADSDANFLSVAGFAPPATGREIVRGALAFAWLAPGEWLITGTPAAVATWLEAANDIGGDDILAIDFTHARVAFELVGSNARSALAAHCPLDLWPEAFPVGAVARTLIGDTVMFIARLEDEARAPRFRIIVDQTMAPYVRRLFASADQL